MSANTLPLESIRIPSGFEFRVRGTGREYCGFTDVPDQETAIFTSDRSSQAFNQPLRVSITSVAETAALAGTGTRRGVEISELVGSDEAVYHDGVWSLLENQAPKADDIIVDGEGIRLFWNRRTVHSITAKTKNHRFGAQASKSYVGYAELVNLMQSLVATDA